MKSYQKADDAVAVDGVERANAAGLTPVVFVHGLWLLVVIGYSFGGLLDCERFL